MQAALKQHLATRVAASLRDFPIPAIKLVAKGLVVQSVAPGAQDEYILTLAEIGPTVAPGDIVSGAGGPFRIQSASGSDITVRSYAYAPEPGRIDIIASIDGRISEAFGHFCELLRQKTGMPWRGRAPVRDVLSGGARTSLLLNRKVVRQPITVVYRGGQACEDEFDQDGGILILRRGVWPKGQDNVFVEYETGFGFDEWPIAIIEAAALWISARMLLRAAGADGNVSGFGDGGSSESYINGLYGTEIHSRFIDAFYLISEYETAAVGR